MTTTNTSRHQHSAATYRPRDLLARAKAAILTLAVLMTLINGFTSWTSEFIHAALIAEITLYAIVLALQFTGLFAAYQGKKGA